jgi:hypothetical protein
MVYSGCADAAWLVPNIANKTGPEYSKVRIIAFQTFDENRPCDS